MGRAVKKSIFDQVVAVTYDYLGPAADRFVAREVEAHLNKNPEDLTKADIVVLIDWCKLAIALMTDNEKDVDEYSRRLQAIANNGAK
jgi:hypothetical protein